MSSAWLSAEETDQALGYLEGRYGIPKTAFARFRLLQTREHICAVLEQAVEAWDVLNGVHAGLKLLRVTGSGVLKPSTRGVQRFGRWATQNVCDLDERELRALLEGRSLPWPEGRGFVILRAKGAVIGMGLVRDGQLVSQLPRAVTMYLRHPNAGESL